jgi:hypothetical protein
MNLSEVSAVIVLLFLQGAVARADAPCASTITEKAVGPATELAGKARKAIAAGQFEEALQLFERAYCLLPEPILKHGLSTAELDLGRCDDAVRDARFWVDHAAPENAEEATHWQDEVVRRCAAITTAAAPTPPPPPQESAPPGTEAPREAAKRLAAEGAAAYKAEDYARALEKFSAAYRLYPAVPLLLNISRAELKLSRCAEALRSAEQFKAEAKDVNPASLDSPDAWLADLQRACIEANVESTPPGATIWIDGQRQTNPDKTPWAGRLPVGKHKVLLWRDGYQKTGMFLKVDADAPAHLMLTLTPASPLEAQRETSPEAVPAPPPVTPPAAPAVQLLPQPVPTREASLSPRVTKSPVLRNVGFAGIAVGGAALIVAVALAVTDQNQITALGKTTTSRSVAQSDAALATTGSEASAADALYVIGGVLAAAGIPLAVVF